MKRKKAVKIPRHAPCGTAVLEWAETISTVPPSLNHAFFNLKKGGRAPTLHYKLWLEGALIELMQRPAWHVPGEVEVRLAFCRAQTRADLDNLTKAVLDMLVKAGRISDDRHVTRLVSEFQERPGTLISVISRAVPALEAA